MMGQETITWNPKDWEEEIPLRNAQVPNENHELDTKLVNLQTKFVET